MKKVAEDNLMIAENKKKQQMENNVREKMQLQQAIADNKIKTPTMVRWSSMAYFSKGSNFILY